MTATAKTAVVTGSSRGIGAATARELAAGGYRVVVNHRSSSEAAEAVVKDIEAAGGTAIAHGADVTRAEDARGLIARAVTEFGGLDVLVCNANVGLGQGPVSSLDWEVFAGKIRDELAAAFHPTQAALPELSRPGGRIVYLSSEAARGPAAPVMAAHGTAKAALNAFALCVAGEVAAQGIAVNVLSAGLVRTEASESIPQEMWDRMVTRIPYGRAGEPTELGRVITFLTGPDAAYLTGQVISLNGGSHLGR